MARRNQSADAVEVQEVPEVTEVETVETEESVDEGFDHADEDTGEEVVLNTRDRLFILVFKNPKASGIVHKIYTSKGYAVSAYNRNKSNSPRLFNVVGAVEMTEVDQSEMASDSPLF